MRIENHTASAVVATVTDAVCVSGYPEETTIAAGRERMLSLIPRASIAACVAGRANAYVVFGASGRKIGHVSVAETAAGAWFTKAAPRSGFCIATRRTLGEETIAIRECP